MDVYVTISGPPTDIHFSAIELNFRICREFSSRKELIGSEILFALVRRTGKRTEQQYQIPQIIEFNLLWVKWKILGGRR